MPSKDVLHKTYEFFTCIETQNMSLFFYPSGEMSELHCKIQVEPKMTLPEGIAYNGPLWPFLLMLRNNENLNGEEKILSIKLATWAAEAVVESNFNYTLPQPKMDLILAEHGTQTFARPHLILRVDNLVNRYEVAFVRDKNDEIKTLNIADFGTEALTTWAVLKASESLLEGEMPFEIQKESKKTLTDINILIRYEMLGEAIREEINSCLGRLYDDIKPSN